MASFDKFVPPLYLALSEPSSWSSKDAQSYCDWLIGSIDEKTIFLIDFFEIKINFQSIDKTSAIEGLLVLGEEIERNRDSGIFYNDSDLTNEGFSLAAHVGLLISRVLFIFRDDLRWEIVKKPKSHISYNLPVISGFGVLSLDPINGAISELYGVFEDGQPSDIWADFFKEWLEKKASRSSK